METIKGDFVNKEGEIIFVPFLTGKWDVVKRLPDLRSASYLDPLWEYMHNEHNIILLATDMQEIIHIVNKIQGYVPPQG